MDVSSYISPAQGEQLPRTLLTVREVAELLHVHPNTVRQWSDEGLIKVYRVGPRGDRRFSPTDLAGVIATSPLNRKCSVLIVDDDPAIRQLLEDAVVKQGCEATVAENGKQALEELEQQRFDLVFLDLMLPELNGLAVLRSIRASGNKMGVALITGYGDDPIALEAMSLGPMFFIRKPFNMVDIIEVLDAMVGVKR